MATLLTDRAHALRRSTQFAPRKDIKRAAK
eukprot:COSAG01_NODE_63142_length_281_cov_0.835165_1_plen_29_part_10